MKTIILSFIIITGTLNLIANTIDYIPPKTITEINNKYLMSDTITLFHQHTKTISERRKQGVRLIYTGVSFSTIGFLVTVSTIPTNGFGGAIAGAVISTIGLGMVISGAIIKSTAEIDMESKK